MTDTGMTSGPRLLATRRATSAWFVLLAATLIIAPHTADLQALAALTSIPPEPSDAPQPAAQSQGADALAPQAPRYTAGSPRSVLVAGGDYADFPGRTGHGFPPRAWLCPDAALYLAPETSARRTVGAGILSLEDAAIARLLDRGPPA